MRKNNSSVLVIGALGYTKNQLDGQTIKTRNVVSLLKEKHNGGIYTIDTLDVKRQIIRTIFSLFINLIRCKTVIIIPANRSLETLFPHLYRLSRIFRYEIILLCVGGWQIEFFNGGYIFQPHPYHLEACKNIKAFMPEIDKVTQELVEKYNFKNCETFTNFRLTKRILPQNTANEISKQLRLVFMARITKPKGYDVIFSFIDTIRDKDLNIKIDFYGPIDTDDEIDFLSKVDKYHDIVAYKGVLQPEDICNTLSTYDLLLLPTRFYTEGVPGTIIDAYAAGIPVVVTNWKHAKEVVIDGTSGIIVDFDNPEEEFANTIINLYNDRDLLNNLKKGTVEGLIPYSSETAWDRLKKYL